MTNRKTISFYTLGCRLNQAETAGIQNSFINDRYRVVDFDQPADIVVINTCTVTENGDADTRRLINKANRLNPQTQIALIGCQAQVQKERLAALANVKWIVGNAKKMDLFLLLENSVVADYPQVITPAIPRESFTVPLAAIDAEHTRANIKIQDGCDFFCSFCEIPYARGRARSRQFADLRREAAALVEAGYQEVVLTGINIGTYQDQGKDIVAVVDALEEIAGLKRIRISSIEPTTIPWKLIEKMSPAPMGSKLCRYLHIPLQSGEDGILESMKRKYSTQEFLNFVQGAVKKVPGICIGTDVIVGFPGESEAHFEKTCTFLRESPIHYFHVFSYSPRTMAKSKDLPDEIPPSIVQRRSRILRDLSQRKRQMYYASMAGAVADVLFEQEKDGFWTGVTDNYIRVKVKSEQSLSNHLLPVHLLHVEGPAMIGELKSRDVHKSLKF